MKHLKKVLIWYLFFAVYIAIFCGLFVGIPEEALHRSIFGHAREVSEIDWDNTHMTILLVLDALLTGMCIFTSSVIIDKRSDDRRIL